MKLTKQQLKQIIKEELEAVLKESFSRFEGPEKGEFAPVLLAFSEARCGGDLQKRMVTRDGRRKPEYYCKGSKKTYTRGEIVTWHKKQQKDAAYDQSPEGQRVADILDIPGLY